MVPALPSDRLPTAAGTSKKTKTDHECEKQSSNWLVAPSLTGPAVSGRALDVVSAPRLHGDGIQPPRGQRRENALIVFSGDTLVLQHTVVVVDQNHVAVQVSGRMAPVHLNTQYTSITQQLNT